MTEQQLAAMRQALEALEYFSDASPTMAGKAHAEDAIALLRQAIAEAEKQEQPLPPVEICVDVTVDGASVVAFYRRPDAVMEMFYSQFHPQPKREPVAWTKQISKELLGVITDVEEGGGFDDVCLNTIKNVYEQLATHGIKENT
jgi:hypothetical protein